MKGTFYTYGILFLIFCMSCTADEVLPVASIGFEKIESSKSGLNFSNILDEQNLKNPFNYINAYTGGGVAIGDINNDGLPDVFMAANMSSSKLFLNKGNMVFEDITTASGTTTSGWCSAVTMADVNNDGWLDIYVCRSYEDNPADRENLLFINDQKGKFTEQSKSYGLNDENYSIGASFFDYDKDGDLDLAVANHPRFRLVPMQVHYDYWVSPVKEFSNRLFRNDGPSTSSGQAHFTDVTEEAGILSYGFSLALSTTDFDVDGWPDLVITVDHDEPDIFFHNNQDGTFTNIVSTATNQTSLSSMGVDAGDINHDIYPDLFVAEMLSEDHYREKIGMGMQTVKRFEFIVDTMKYKYYQMHNFMYLNNGNKTFSDVAQLAGVHKSDWSWATLFFDFDNDGWQDLFISNGWYKDIYNNDRKRALDSLMLTMNGDMAKMNKVAQDYSINSPIPKIQNYLFKNHGDLQFSSYADEAGILEKTISTGAAYGDLDNDGDLDLVINNIGEEALLYRNNANPANHYLSFQFEHTAGKTAIGSKVNLHYGDDFQSRELLATRGFLSSSEQVLHFGLGSINEVDKVEVVWPDGKMQILDKVKTNAKIKVKYEEATGNYVYPSSANDIVKEINSEDSGLDYVQNENRYHDYDDQVLLPHKLSEYGPYTAIGDINNDGLEDIYFGSPLGQAGAMYIQKKGSKFERSNTAVFNADKAYEDGQPLFFDADGDGDLDLAISSTGYEIAEDSPLFQPRLYLNDGKGNYQKSMTAFPDFRFSASCIKAADFDQDGDQDIFIGGRLTPKKYPIAGTSGLFVNDGKGNFTEASNEVCPDLQHFGMIKDAMWTDINQDSLLDLIVVGEWTPISFWIQEDGKLVDRTKDYFETPLTGWWNTIEKADLDNNGLDDYIIGNLGRNYKYKASKEKPFML
ncbi:MAG: hypothetical protein ACI8VT_004425, partial [Saprospiraceae bacterium]